MRKARNKKFALMMAIVFLFTIMVPLVGPAAAGTTYTVHSSKSWDSDQDGAVFQFSVKIDPCSVGAHAAIVKFNSDVLIQNVETSGTVVGDVYGLTFEYEENDNEFLVKFTNNELEKVEFVVKTTANLDNYTGIINADIDRLYGDFVSASANGLGRAGDGDITVSTGKVAVITEAGGEINPIYMKENTSNAVRGEKKALKVKLPKGFEWRDVSVEDVTTGTKNVPFDIEDNDRSIYISGNNAVLNAEGIPNYLKITGSLKVIDKKAKYGDITAELSSDVTLEPTSIVVAKYADYVATVEADKDDVIVLAGRIDEEISDIIIKEEAPGSLIEGRSISLTLPNNAKWYFGEDEKGNIIDKGDVDVSMKTDKGSKITFKDTYLVDSRTLKLVVNKGTEDGDAATLRLKDLSVMLAGDETGDLVIDVTGNAGIKGEVTVAEVVAPVTATSTIKDIKVGLQGQVAGDITIVEVAKEAIMDENDVYDWAALKDSKEKKRATDTELLVRLPYGIDWTTTPKVDVTEGDLELGEVKIDLEDNVLIIPIEDSSDKASTIKISDVKLTVNRSLPEGKVEVKIGGDAVNETYFYDIFKAWTVASVDNGNIITPAPGETKQNAVFTLGSSTYTVNGVEQTMDAAAFAQDSRTYLPIRYAALALGVNESNILWDGANQTVTLIKGDKVVQVKVGSNLMSINGAQVGMDVGPLAKDGRTFLPFRWIATAFGATVDYDATNQTVTMNLETSQQN